MTNTNDSNEVGVACRSLVRRLRCFFRLVWRPSTHPPGGMTEWQVRIKIPLAWELAGGLNESLQESLPNAAGLAPLPGQDVENTLNHQSK